MDSSNQSREESKKRIWTKVNLSVWRNMFVCGSVLDDKFMVRYTNDGVVWLMEGVLPGTRFGQQQRRRRELEGGAATTSAALSCSQSRANSFQPPEEDKGTIGPVVFLSVSRWLSVVFPNRTNHQSLSISLYPSLKWSIGMIPNGTVQLVQLTSTLWCNRRSL